MRKSYYFILFFSLSLWLEMTENKKLRIACFGLFILAVFALGKAILFWPLSFNMSSAFSLFNGKQFWKILKHYKNLSSSFSF